MKSTPELETEIVRLGSAALPLIAPEIRRLPCAVAKPWQRNSAEIGPKIGGRRVFFPSGSDAVYTTNFDTDHSHTFTLALSAFTAPADTNGATSIDEGHAHAVAISAAQLQNVQVGQPEDAIG